MDLVRHLRFFLAVAQQRHFGDAALTLGMTQPPLSQGILRLEKNIGVRLFDRGARGVTVTPAGAWLLPLAEDVVRRADAFVEEAGAWSSAPVLRIGVAADLEEAAGELVCAVTGLAGEVRPTLCGSVELVDRLKSAELDIAVVRHPGVLDGVIAGPVHTLPRQLRRAAETVRAADMRGSDMPVAVPPRRWQPAAHDQLVDSLRRLGHSGRVIEESDLLARRALVAAGAALGLEAKRSSLGARVPGSAPEDAHVDLAALSLRARAVQPVVSDRQAGLDHDAIRDATEAALLAIESER